MDPANPSPIKQPMLEEPVPRFGDMPGRPEGRGLEGSVDGAEGERAPRGVGDVGAGAGGAPDSGGGAGAAGGNGGEGGRVEMAGWG